MKNKPLYFGNTTIHPGERITIALPTPEIYTCAPMYVPVHIIHGKKDGPCLLIGSALHGDEMNGLALIQRLMQMQLLHTLQGTLIIIPVINIFGLLTHSRFLPDRRDLDGSFPGSEMGSFAGRLAHHLNREIFSKADYCIDIHSGEPNYYKMPQVQTNLDHEASHHLAKSFQAPLIIHTSSQRGMLWQIQEYKKPTLIYETGEALRLDELGIKIGIRGILQVMRHLGMLKFKKEAKTSSSLVVRSRQWVRAPYSGLCTLLKKYGMAIKKGDLLFRISDPFGTSQIHEQYAPFDGIVISQNNLPLVNEGDPVLELAGTKDHLETWEKQDLDSLET